MGEDMRNMVLATAGATGYGDLLPTGKSGSSSVDQVAKDNQTMLGMLQEAGLLRGGMQLALQMYVVQCLPKLHAQETSSVDVVEELVHLDPQQQRKMRYFLLRVSGGVCTKLHSVSGMLMGVICRCRVREGTSIWKRRWCA